MKRILFLALMVVTFMILPIAVQAYTINDPSDDGIGSTDGFETNGINVYNFTPGINSGSISFDIFTDYPEDGITVGSWVTTPADLFITENYQGTDYEWAIPLVDHDSFNAGTMYAVGTVHTSDYFDPDPGTFIYNHDAPVQIATIGENYGFGTIPNQVGTVLWNSNTSNPLYTIHVDTGVWEDDPDATFDLYWATATCGNDLVGGSAAPVPEPATMFLLGTGLIGLAGFGRKKFFKKG